MIRATSLKVAKTAASGNLPSSSSSSSISPLLNTARRQLSSTKFQTGRFVPTTINGQFGLTSRRFQIHRTSASNNAKASVRKFSDQPPGDKGKSSSSDKEGNELVLTPGQKVVVGSRLALWLAAAGLASVSLYFIGKELFPTKMSPNSVFNSATSIVQNNTEVQRRFGTPLKAFGRDHGGSREGRRNFVEHTEYTNEEDGSKRTRVRFNLEGPHGKAFVFAEVSKDMPSGEFVYLMVQDKQNGRIITVVDNRSALLAKKMAGGSKKGEEAFGNLLGGGRSN